MTTISPVDPYRIWRNERERDLDRWVEDASTSAAIEGALNKITNAGNAERALAGSHEGREILELLQNARDAISNGESETGHVYVGVFETGILVANTGDPFDLLDEEIMNSVRKVGESKKSGDSIGHKGVGLNSVLSVGDAFEVWSRLPELDDPLRVRYSRSYLTAALAQRFGHEVSIDGLAQTLHPEGLVEDADGNRRLTAGDTHSPPVPLPDDVGKLPLFWYPWPLRPETEASPVANRAYDLLTSPHDCLSTFETPPDEAFRTAVFIEYEDDLWRDLLDQLNVAHPDEGEETISSEEQANLLWEYLSDTVDRSTSLRPETLVQLGEIEDLYLERINESGTTTGAEHWHVNRQSESVPSESLRYERVETTISHAIRETRLTLSFDHFWQTDCPETEPSLLVPRTQEEGSDATNGENSPARFRSEYPLYLFYPINRTERHSLPFCLHGRFRVSTDRQDLSQSSKGHNLDVLEDGVALIEGVAAVTADLGTENPARWAVYPWVLLPPETDESLTDPASTVELMEWLCTEIYDRLTSTKCFPDQRGQRQYPRNATVHPNEDVVKAFVACHGIKLHNETPTSQAALPPLPHLQELVELLSSHPVWQQRVKTLVIKGDNREAFTERILSNWTRYLGDERKGGRDSEIAIEVERSQAKDLFTGTTALIKERAEQIGGSVDVLKTHADTLDGVYLLPCEQAESTANSWLVQVEYRKTPGAGRSARTVVWGQADELQSDDFPPKHGNFDVYFLEEAIQESTQGILSNAGDYWGMRQSDGFAELYRSLLGTFGTDRRREIDAGSLGALASLITRVDESRVTSLRTDEASFFPAEYAKNAPEPSKRDRRRQINTRLRLRRTTIDVLEQTPLAELTFPTSWQRERALARNEDENAGETAELEAIADWSETADIPGPSLPVPSAPVWEEVPVTEGVPDKQRRLARLLSLLGVSGLPGLRILWMYGPDHPQIQGSSQPHWNPLNWKQSIEQRRKLSETLSNHEAYLQWLISATHHPSQSQSHAYSCSKSPVLEKGGSGSNLVAWIWFDSAATPRLTEDPDALIETLGRHDQQYRETVLTTNWFCKSYQTCNPSHGLPTLANWQLRQLPIWNSILEIRTSVEAVWGEDGDRLAWAVLEGGKSGSQGWRLFPSVDPVDTPLSESLLNSLGVKGLDDLSVSEAEYRLQKLQAVLAGDISETRRSTLQIPSERRQDWGSAYSRLLQPIMRYVSREDITDIDELREEFTYLTHIPLRRIHEEGDQWLAAPLSWLADHTDEVRRYPEESPTPWEQKRVRDNKWDLLDFPKIQTGFAAFASALGIDTVEAHKPVPSTTDNDFNLVDGRRERTDLSADRQALRRRQTLLLASIGTSDDERIVEEAEKLETAIENLAIAESFPKRVSEQLSDPRSGLYRTPAGDIGLVYNKAEAETLELDALAMGLALLFEQYRNVSVFETALDPEQSRTDLRERWRKETFPIQTVQTAIEDHTRRNVRKKLSAGRDLLERVVKPADTVPSAEALMEEFDAKDENIEEAHLLARIGEAVQDSRPLETSNQPKLSAYISVCRSSGTWIQTVLTKLFGVDENSTRWRDLIHESVPEVERRVVIEWLVEYEQLIDESLFTDEFVPTVERFVAIYRAWGRTSDPSEQLGSPEAWQAIVRDQYRATSLEIADHLPSRLRELTDIPSSQRWFFFENTEALSAEVVDPFLDYLVSEVGVDTSVREMLNSFVTSGDFGREVDKETKHDHKSRAYATAEDAIISDRAGEFAPFQIDEEHGGSEGDSSQGQNASVRIMSGQGGRGGGGSSQLRGRGEQAEVAVTLDLLQSLRLWIQDDDERYSTFTETIRELWVEQQETAYRWHTQTEWKDTLLPLLDNPQDPIQRQFTDYRSLLSEGVHLDDLAPVKLLDVSGENGPGFDIIDPFGTLHEREGKPPEWSLNPAPVEIKAVSGASPPFGFRFTTNEFRQAKRFTQDEEQRYVLRFIDVPAPETEDWLPQTRCVHERVFTSPKDFDEMISGYPFEDAVKGGYLNVSVGGESSNGS